MTNPQPSPSVTINRALVGVIAAVMLISAGTLWYFAGNQNMWTGACLKVGLVVAALWLALPVISRRDNWGKTTWPTLIGGLALLLVLTGKRVDFRIVLPMLFGVAITIMVLRPKSKPGRK